MQVFDAASFFKEFSQRLFYVGFLKSTDAWFPMCFISDPQAQTKLDTLMLSLSLQAMDSTLAMYAERVPQVENTFVQYLTQQEIQNLVEFYALDNIALVHLEDEQGGCGCGCDCG